MEGLREAPNIHPLFLHLPLVLLPVALLFRILALAMRRDEFFKLGRWLLYLAGFSVIAAAWSGLGAEEQLGHDTPLHEIVHRHEDRPDPEAKETRDGRQEKREPHRVANHQEHAPKEPSEDKRDQDGAKQHEQHQEHKPRKAETKQEAHRPEQHRAMSGTLGLPHAREASGTSWQPDSTPMHAVHFMEGGWTLMVHGNVFVGYDYQSGKRGEDEWISTNWFMFMAGRPLAGGELGLRSMLSLEPATVGRDGYPLLLQTGESLGDEPLHDDQHAHDLFMELAAMYARPVMEDVGVQLYAAPSGEPALGPTAFPHRMSASSDPLAPLGHHWQDSTHISFGVLTAGVFTKYAKLEGSWFNGREPDENRWDFDIRMPDSYSGRFTVNPSENLSAQVSYGHLRSPEKLEPDVSLNRATASVTFNQPWREDGNWATTLAWGGNKPEGETATHSFLLETSFEIDRHHNPFARLEYLKKSGHDLVLIPGLEDDTFGVGSAVLGYVYNFDPIGSVIPGLGFRFSVNLIEDDLEPFYGRTTSYGFMIFLRLWPSKTDGEKHGKGHH